MLEFQGVNPKELPRDTLLDMVRQTDQPGCSIETAVRNRIRNPLTAIRAMCILCQGGSIASARNCEKTNCPLWMFRMGKNPLFNSRKVLVDGKEVEVIIDEEDNEDLSDLEAQEKQVADHDNKTGV